MYFARCGRQAGVKMPPAMPIESASKVKATFHLAEFDEVAGRGGEEHSHCSTARLPSFAVNFVFERCRYPFGNACAGSVGKLFGLVQLWNCLLSLSLILSLSLSLSLSPFLALSPFECLFLLLSLSGFYSPNFRCTPASWR